MNERIFDSRLAERIAGDDTARRDRLKAVARMLVGVVRDGLVRDGIVRVHGFGTFQLRPTKPRRGINPHTGERILIPARHRVIFRPAKALRERVDPDPGLAVPLAEPRPSREVSPASDVPPGEGARERPAVAAAIPQAVVSTNVERAPASAPLVESGARPVADVGRDTGASGEPPAAGAAANESTPAGEPEPPDEGARRRTALVALLLLAFVAVLAWLLWPAAREPVPPVAEEPATPVTAPEGTEPVTEAPTDPDSLAPAIAATPVEPSAPEPETTPPASEVAPVDIPLVEAPPAVATPPLEISPVEISPAEIPSAEIAPVELSGPLTESYPLIFAEAPAVDAADVVVLEPLQATLAALAPAVTEGAPAPATPPIAGTDAPAVAGEWSADLWGLDERVAALGADLDVPVTVETAPVAPVPSGADPLPGAREAVPPDTAVEASASASEAAQRAIAEPTDPAAATTGRPWFAAREYTVQPGDTLWGLAEGNYVNPYYWPHIFNHNAATVTNPDRIAIDQELLLPALQGEPAALTEADRTSIAEGYLRLYRFWAVEGRANADYALVGVRFFDAGVLPADLADAGHPSDALAAAFHAQLSAHYSR